MSSFPIPELLRGYWQDGFLLKSHLQAYLQISEETLTHELATGCQEMALLGHRDFAWDKASAFYGTAEAGRRYLFDLAAWHLTSQQHIGDTLRLLADHARGIVLDFGSGIGTHALAAALCPAVEKVYYCDLNPILRQFIQLRAEQLGLGEKLIPCTDLSAIARVDTICCFDVFEHLPDPGQQLLTFHHLLAPKGKLITNWYFFRGLNEEYPFHLDYRTQPQLIEQFYQNLQRHFLEIFHPYFTTTRCYRKA
jgi:SAM-dependent methyltransferase